MDNPKTVPKDNVGNTLIDDRRENLMAISYSKYCIALFVNLTR